MSVVDGEGGVHPKLATRLEKMVFQDVERIGGDILQHKRRKTSQRTWKDSSINTMYLD